MILHNGGKISIGSPEEVAQDEQVIEVYLGAEYC
jgi:ABC-type branched-subunit amino acid transport system ATPase component